MDHSNPPPPSPPAVTALAPWEVTVQAPATFTLRGCQLASPYAGLTARITVTFPDDYPFREPRLTVTAPPVALFHVLVDPWVEHASVGWPCVGASGRHDVDRSSWSPAFTARDAVARLVTAMFVDGDAWLAVARKVTAAPLLSSLEARALADEMVAACGERSVALWRGSARRTCEVTAPIMQRPAWVTVRMEAHAAAMAAKAGDGELPPMGPDDVPLEVSVRGVGCHVYVLHAHTGVTTSQLRSLLEDKEGIGRVSGGRGRVLVAPPTPLPHARPPAFARTATSCSGPACGAWTTTRGCVSSTTPLATRPAASPCT
jgi:ubiquitin-protein ligase